MNETHNVPGKSYNETILQCMMYYPTIFPSESAAAQHLFIGFGTGYGWNTNGQIAYYLASKLKTNPGRTKESIIGENIIDPYGIDKWKNFAEGERVCFYPCGGNITLWTSNVSEKYSPIMYVIRDKVKPNDDWKQALSKFCYSVLSQNEKAYKQFFSGYVKLTYPGTWKEQLPYYLKNYSDIRDTVKKLKDKWTNEI